MSYCAKPDMIAAFGEQEVIALTDRTYNAAIDDAVLDAAIADAEAEINIWLGSRYVLPFATPPAGLKRIACAITRYILAGDIAEDHPTAVRYRAQLKVLQAMAKSDKGFGPDDAGNVAEVSDGAQIAAGRNDFGDRSSW